MRMTQEVILPTPLKTRREVYLYFLYLSFVKLHTVIGMYLIHSADLRLDVTLTGGIDLTME